MRLTLEKSLGPEGRVQLIGSKSKLDNLLRLKNQNLTLCSKNYEVWKARFTRGQR